MYGRVFVGQFMWSLGRAWLRAVISLDISFICSNSIMFSSMFNVSTFVPVNCEVF
jgi:hypothetical protein